MADTNPEDLYDSHPESSGYPNDDFEKLDPPGSGFDQDNGEDEDADDQNVVGSSGAYDFDSNQDAKISTTTDIAGEDEAEEDRYAIGASEAEAYAHSHDEPLNDLINFGLVDDINQINDDEIEDDHYQVQPSAPVPDSNESFNDNPTDPDFLTTLATSAPPSSHYPESFPTSSSKQRPFDAFDDFIEPKRESKPVKSTEQSSEETSSSKGDLKNEIVSDISADDVILRPPKNRSHFQRTAIYRSFRSLGTWLKGVDPREPKDASPVAANSPTFFQDLIYWRDVKKTGIVFGTLLMILVSLAVFSLLSVIAYLSLAVLTVTFSFVVYKKIMGAVQKSSEGHPFKTILELDIELSEQKLKSVIQSILKNVNSLTNELRRLFLIEDIVDSIKFGLLLWALTYIGSWFSGMFLIVLGLVLLFTLPKVYETYKVQIDNYFGLAKAQVNNVLNIIQSKLPFLKKKDKAQ
ncbi:unnamed protein product [Lymnaea stagnalis]|uniref:Reticulon-like protein n=1 Tax=Lymnaea stagnalis TaxID=6523 RepID=A0AAV2H0D7_LYMST